MGRGYEAPPWTFRGRAIYQLQLVKVEEAKKYIPKELKIISMFGYTLGGFYLARYCDSPVGVFDECVALAGLVWNKASSCAWAARVYVNNREARDHGRRLVGLPSRMCALRSSAATGEPAWLDVGDAGEASSLRRRKPANGPDGDLLVSLHNLEMRRSWWPIFKSQPGQRQATPVCSFRNLPSGYGKKGMRVKLTLPSFSGKTTDVPSLLKYACNLTTHVRLLKPVQTSCPELTEAEGLDNMKGILGGKPLLALLFDDLVMVVHDPVAVSDRGTHLSTTDNLDLKPA